MTRTKDRSAWRGKNRGGPIDCFEPFAESELEGCACWGGLDLSIVSDCSALALIFPWGSVEPGDEQPAKAGDLPIQVDESYRLLIRFWLPETTAHMLRDRVPYESWAAAGWITLTDGDEVDFSRIIDDIGELSNRFRIQEIRYDRAYAATVMQQVEQVHGVQRAEFPQTMMNFTLPSKIFERCVSRKLIKHAGNPCLTWQIGHCKVKSDHNGNIRPVRPQKGDFRTVDGVQAAVMALSGALERPRGSDWDGTIEYL